MMKRTCLYFTILLGCLSCLSCFSFDIKNDIDYPLNSFSDRQQQILHLDQKIPPANLSLMFYEGEERRLISLSIPLSLIETAAGEDLDDVRKYSKKYIGSMKIRDLKRITQMGRGLIIEVKDREENNHLLLWME